MNNEAFRIVRKEIAAAEASIPPDVYVEVYAKTADEMSDVPPEQHRMYTVLTYALTFMVTGAMQLGLAASGGAIVAELQQLMVPEAASLVPKVLRSVVSTFTGRK